MGTATEAITGLGQPDADRDRLVAQVAIADAICYVFGAIGAIWFCRVMAPRLLGVDLKTESLALEESLGMKRSQPGSSPAIADSICARTRRSRMRRSSA